MGILLSTDFYSYIYFSPRLTYHVFLGVIYILVIIQNGNRYRESFLDFTVKWTVLSIFLSIIPAVIDYNQYYISTFLACFHWSYCLLLYFILKRYQFPTRNLLIIISFFSVIWVFFELFQQLTYPDFLFSWRFKTHGEVHERMGMWRFYILGVDFVMLAYAYWLGESDLKKQKKLYPYLLCSIFLLGLLCYGSRKHIYATLVALLFFTLWNGSGRKKFIKILLVSVFFILLYLNFYDQWTELNTDAAQVQGEGEEFIRYMSADYYLFHFSDSNLYPIFGAGLPVQGSSLYAKIDIAHNMFGDMHGFWQSDVGIIGYYSMFGLLGVSAIFMYIIYFIINWKFIDTWFKYFFIMKMMLIVFDFWAMWAPGMTVYAIFLYLLDKNIRYNKNKKLYENRNIDVLSCH